MKTRESEAKRLRAAPNIGEAIIGAAAVASIVSMGYLPEIMPAISSLWPLPVAGVGVLAAAMLDWGGGGHRTWADWDAGTYIVGKPRQGKTTYAMSLFRDLLPMAGCAWITTHGASDVAAMVPEERLVLFSPPRTPGLNVMAGRDPYMVANRITTLFRRMYPDAGPRMDQLLYTAALTVAQEPEADLWKVLKFVDDEYARAESRMGEVATMSWSDASRASVQSLRDRLGRMLVSPRLRRGLSDPDGIDLDRIVAEEKVLVVDVRQDDTADAAILCEAVLGMLQQVGARRREGAMRWPVFADEFQGYADASLNDWIAEGPKRHMPLVLIHQGRRQLPASLQEATMLCGSIYAFGLAWHDARELSPMLGVPAEELAALPVRAYAAAELMGGHVIRVRRTVPLWKGTP